MPLPPNYPAARCRAIVDDCQPRVIVAPRAPAWAAGYTIIDPSRPAEPIAPINTSEEDAAYLIYTSGSTGTPKGVLVSHRGLESLVVGQAEMFGVRAGDRVLQFAALGFDAVVSEIVVTLGIGATLCIPDGDQLRSLAELTNFVRDTNVRIATFPPSILELLDPAAMPGLTTVVAAGEACPAHVVRAWAPGRRFVNAYGPTEATVCATMAVLTSETVTIGRPMRGVTIHLLASDGAEVEPGQVGEIAIGGDGVACGYWNRPAETAAAFVPDRFSSALGSRLYLTGDLGRMSGDDLEFIGRRDHQLKVSGYRIEPAEIETALRAVSGSDRCIAFAVDPPDGPRELVAAVVVNEQGPSPAELRTRLAERLPAFMIPSRLLLLSEWPLTANGKIDRARLDALALASVRPATTTRTHQTTEDTIIDFWQRELGGAVALDDDFYHLGGTSLKLMRLLAAVESHFAVRVSISELLDDAVTPRRMALLITSAPIATPEGQLRFHPKAAGVPIFFVPPVVGDPLVFASLARELPAHPIFALRPPGLEDGEQPIDHLETLVARFARLVHTEARGRPVVVGGYSIGGLSAYELARQLHDSSVNVRCLLLIEAPVPPGPEARTRMGPFTTANMAIMCARFLAATVGQTLGLEPATLATLTDDDVLVRFRAELIRLGLASEQTPMQSVVRRLNLFKTNLRAHLEYEAGVYTGPTAMIWSEDGHPFAKGNKALFDWSHVLQPVAQRRVPGNHFTLISAEHARSTAEAIRSILAELS